MNHNTVRAPSPTLHGALMPDKFARREAVKGLWTVQEYTSAVDGKVRIRVLRMSEREEIRVLGGHLGHWWGNHEGQSYACACHIADVQRLERRIGGR